MGRRVAFRATACVYMLCAAACCAFARLVAGRLLRWKGFEFSGPVPEGLVPFIEAFTSHPWHFQVNDLYSRSLRVCFDELITGGEHSMAVDSLREFGEAQARSVALLRRVWAVRCLGPTRPVRSAPARSLPCMLVPFALGRSARGACTCVSCALLPRALPALTRPNPLARRPSPPPRGSPL